MRARVLFVAIALVSACVDPPPGDDAVDQTTEAVTVQSYWWDQYLGHDVRMMSVTDGICFFTEITGRFRGSMERVSIVPESDGYWWMGGASDQVDVGAAARCVPWSSFATDHGHVFLGGGWQVNRVEDGITLSTPLEPFDKFCYLAQFQGLLDGPGEYARVDPAPGGWVLDAHSDANANVYGQNSLWAGAVCADVAQVGELNYVGGALGSLGEYTWTQGQAPARMAPIANAECFLEGITGRFEGSGESVQVVDGGDGWWYLTGSSYQVGVGGRARCLDHVQSIEALARDGGFEQQPSSTLSWPWTGEGTGGKGIDRGRGFAHTGANNAWVSATTGWNAVTETVAVRPYTQYTLVGWTRTSNAGNAAYFGVRGSDEAILAESHFGATDDADYTKRTVIFNSGNNTVVRVYAGYWAPGPSWMQVDDVSMAKY